MTHSMEQITITLDPGEASTLLRDIDELEKSAAHLIPFNSKLREIHFLLKMYGARI